MRYPIDEAAWTSKGLLFKKMGGFGVTAHYRFMIDGRDDVLKAPIVSTADGQGKELELFPDRSSAAKVLIAALGQ